MASRLELQNKLEELLGSRSVYYQPPKSKQISYPAIIYTKVRPNTIKADNLNYIKTNCYEISVISAKIDHPVIEKIMEFPMCSYDRRFESDNLYHDIFRLYY